MNRSAGPAAPAAAPSTPITAPVIEYACLFSHDLKRKQKRWKDGRLKFHAFNKRIMVYDERGNSIGDMHWQESAPLDEGDEINLDRGGVVVQVGECKGARDQDITQLLVRKSKAPVPPQTAPSAKKSAATALNLSRPAAASFQTPSRGPLGRAIPPNRSPFDERQAVAAVSADLSSPNQTSLPPAKRRRFEERQQKPAYATSLFGAALTLSGSTGSAPMLPRQGIPRLHSVDQRVQPTTSITSLRASYRQTRAPEMSEGERTPRQERTTASKLKQAPVSVRQAFRDMASRNVDIIELAADKSQAKAPKPRELTKRIPDNNADIDSTPRPTKRTKNMHSAPAARKDRPEESTPSSKSVQPARPAQPTAHTTAPVVTESIPMPPASQPRVELRLGSKRKRKGLMIAAAPPPPVLELMKSPTPEMLPQQQDSIGKNISGQKNGDMASSEHDDDKTAEDERIARKAVEEEHAEEEKAKKKRAADQKVHEAIEAAFDDLEEMIAKRSKTAQDSRPEPPPVPRERKLSPRPSSQPTMENLLPPVHDDTITIELSATNLSDPMDHVERDVFPRVEQADGADSIMAAVSIPSSPVEDHPESPDLVQASLRPESPPALDDLQIPESFPEQPSHPPYAKLPPSPEPLPSSELPPSPGLSSSARPPSLGPSSPGLLPVAHFSPSPVPGESPESPEQPFSSPMVPPESFLSANNTAKFMDPDAISLDDDDEAGRRSRENEPNLLEETGDVPENGKSNQDLAPGPSDSLQVPSKSVISAPKVTDSSDGPSEPASNQVSTRSSLRRTPSATAGLVSKQQPFRVPSLLKKSKSTVSAANARASDAPVALPRSLSRSHSSSTHSGLSCIIARTEGALHADTPLLSTTAAAIMPRLGAAKDAATRIGGFAPASVVRMENGEGKETDAEWAPSQESGTEGAVVLVLPPVQRFPGFTRISGDAWSREAYDLFEWKRPVA